MQTQLERAELTNRLLAELQGPEETPDPLLGAFGRTLLRRVDDAYLFRHRLTTLSGQIRDSLSWLRAEGARGQTSVRVFQPVQEEHGYTVEGFVIETVMPDQSFIFDTLKLLLDERAIRVLNYLRLVIPVRADDDGEIIAIGDSGEETRNLGYTRWYVAREGVEDAAALTDEIRHRLQMAQAMVSDFRRMIRDVRALANEYDFLANSDARLDQDYGEVRDFLSWLLDDHFVFMGLSQFTFETRPGEAQARHLGIEQSFGDFVIDPDTRALIESEAPPGPPLCRVRKSSMDSRLHRRGKVDEIVVRTFDADLKPTGAVVIHGLFTHKGLVQYGGTIPILRGKLARILQEEGLLAGDYDHKSAVSAFNSLPVEFLFGAPDETIVELLRMTRTVDDRQEVRSHFVPDADRLSAYVFVALPKQSYSDDIRVEIQSALRALLRATYTDHRVHLGKYGSVTLHFYVTCNTPFSEFQLAQLGDRISAIGTPWEQRLRLALELDHGESAGAGLYGRYRDAFTETYMERVPVEQALVDIRHIERLAADATIPGSDQVRLDVLPQPRQADEADDEALLRIYSRRELLLTDILPVVDNFGVIVAEQMAYVVPVAGAPKPFQVNILRVKRGEPDLRTMRHELVEGLSAVFHRRMRSDRINRLLLKARIRWQEVEVLRAFFYYSRQLGSHLTPEIVQKTLVNHSPFVHTLIELFRARFDPARFPDAPDARAAECDRLHAELEAWLDRVEGADEDRILRIFLNLVEATVRTNFYAPRRSEVHYTSFKFDCARVESMPAPKPMFEIYVHAADIEGVHLRGGRIARGGIRWSDRLDDYRAEVLGLVTTQMLKNAVIVPVGAKGGFVLKTPPEDWQEARAQADRFYRIYVRGILDLTDNLDGETIVPPAGVVCHDEPDPYVVVAADKGTAHLSDTANALAREYGFWLDDAFASGGSIGYDHKDKGITAGGTWVCVRRHFAELGIDPNREPITVVGIGDMSGDVFGNGLLSSQTLKLIGAFDHRHIFLDPNPDPERSFQERKRLFELPRSKWTDYDTALLSEGGGIFERGAKAIALTPAVQKRLKTEATSLSGDELIRLLLKADVDLLWNGGIGTYVKASSESHADVSDAANDRVRVDANALRCRVIGEGGNLGLTTKARVEFAALGGRLNLDAIDNAGGVDLSDHEVNLKTLLQLPMRDGELSREDRDALIVAVGDEVCAMVLANNEGQGLAISLDELRSQGDIWAFNHGMLRLREHLGFSRYVEHLPRTPEVIRQRQEQGRGFLRPELGKLLSHSKVHLARQLTDSPAGDRQALLPLVSSYFPHEVVARHGSHIEHHFLFDAIAATVITNRLVDRAGIMAIPNLEIATERSTAAIAAAWLVADELLMGATLIEGIHALEEVSTDIRYPLLVEVEGTILSFVRCLLWQREPHEQLDMGVKERLGTTREILERLQHRVSPHLPDRIRRDARDRARTTEGHGVPAELAKQLTRLPFSGWAPVMAGLVETHGCTADEAIAAFFHVGYESHALDLIETALGQSYPDRWDFVAVWPIIRQLMQTISDLAGWTLKAKSTRGSRPDLGAIGTEIEEVLGERVPVSAMLVLSDRLKRRFEALAAS